MLMKGVIFLFDFQNFNVVLDKQKFKKKTQGAQTEWISEDFAKFFFKLLIY